MKLIPVILCGGAGSRLWPVSRELNPKPFITLSDGQSLLQKAWLRGAHLADVTEILTISNTELYFKTKEKYREVASIPHTKTLFNSFVLEPFGRNTAPAIAIAALTVAATHGEEACMLVLPADQLIMDQSAFEQAVGAAMKLAADGQLVTFGIQPTGPETGYGYIEADGSKVIRFVEKPSLQVAQTYIDSGKYLWNAGMFCFKAGAMLHEMQLHCPEILEASRACLAQSETIKGNEVSQIQLNSASFEKVPDDSIDYAVIEKSSNVAVVPCDIGWSDIGSWDALGNLTPEDADGNRIQGEVILHDVTNCYIQSNQHLVAAVGVDNLIIIDTPDAILVTDRNHAQDVKKIYARLKSEGHEAHRLHRTVHRPWGAYTVLEEGPSFKIKRIEVKPGASLSLQMHHHRSEHWIVVSGMAKVFIDDKELFVNTNESAYIHAGQKHRLLNPGLLGLVMIEVQSGEYLGEDDIVRFEDVYGRAKLPS
ncbi:MAG: mannose-1-phosphate guanylyltransferase/mannose-6-phosphate isomerase [Nitrosomonadales bacterium]